jgi:hypothetical protein
MSSRNCGIKTEYKIYKKSQMISWLIIGIISVSIIGILQIYEGSDSIVEIQIDPTFTFDNSTIIYSIDNRNKTLGELNASEFRLAVFGAYFSSPDKPFASFSYADKVRFAIKPIAFEGTIQLIQKQQGFLYKQFGVIEGSITLLTPGSIYKIRIPRGNVLLFINFMFYKIPNLWNFSLILDDIRVNNFYFISPQIFGIPLNANMSDVTTTHEKMILTIHNLVWNQTDYEYNKAVQSNNTIIVSEIEPRMGLYLNTSVSRGGIADLFDPSIK